MSPFTAELADGKYIERRGGDYTHGRCQGLVAAALSARERERRFHAFISLTIRVGDERYRIPDVCAKALPYERAPILTCPDLVIEIVSPDDEVQEMLIKIGDYLATGIPYIWVVDPYKRTVVEAGHGSIRRVNTLRLSTPLVGEVDFAALFDQLAPAE